MTLKKINKFEADLDPAYRRGHNIEDLKVTFNAKKNGKAPILKYELFNKLESLETKTNNERFSRSDLHISLRRSGMPITLQERTHWIVELTARAMRIVTGRRYTNSMVIEMLFSNLLDRSISQKDIGSKDFFADSPQDDQQKNIISTQALLRKIFYVDLDLSSDKDGDFVEMFIPKASYHPVPLLKFLLLGIIEPKLLSDTEFLQIVHGFKLPDIELSYGNLQDTRINSRVLTDSDKFEIISNAELDIERIIAEQKKVLEKNPRGITLDRGGPRMHTRNGFIKRQIFLSHTKMCYLEPKKIELFNTRFELLKKIMPAAGEFSAKVSGAPIIFKNL